MRVKEILKEKGMSQKDLAKRMNVQDGTMSNILSGRYSPTLDTLQRIADALGVEVAELFAPIARCPHCGQPISLQKLS